MAPLPSIKKGDRFGRLTVLNEMRNRDHRGYRQYRVSCTCGLKKVICSFNLTRGTRSCGCLQREKSSEILSKIRPLAHAKQITHGHTLRSEYKIWSGMIQRCENSNRPNFKDYGGRGIRVCKRWRKSYVAFFSDMGARPSPLHSLDRYPNNDGDYKPSNCRWATKSQQQNNRRRRQCASTQ